MADTRSIGQIVADSRRYERMKANTRRPRVCEECGQNPADPPGRICVGCEAYKEHQR